MGIAQALTNDLERALRLYRIPILVAVALSLRRHTEDLFLLTDARQEDKIRDVVRLRRISACEQAWTLPGVGVDDRQFTALTSNLMFTGLPDANGVVQPLGNLTNVGGRVDLDGTIFTATGDTTAKQAKARRYNVLRPGDVCWRVRSPVMMADATSVLDFLALRCTQLRYLHSVTLKWSDRRWDTRAVGLDEDLYRPAGERSQMIIMAPMWMDDSMSVLNPAVWGPYESMIQANYEEALGRKIDEQVADCAAFVATFNDYLKVLRPSLTADPEDVNASVHGRVSRYLDQTASRALHLPFNRQVISVNRNDSYRVVAVDPGTATDVTQDVFNLFDAQNHWRLTSSFEANNLADDGWCGTGAVDYVTDIPPSLPPFAYDRAGQPVYGTHAARVTDGYACHRLALPNGTYALRLWLRTDAGSARVEVIKNNRLIAKGWVMSETPPRVTTVRHWRQNYETVAAATVLHADGWRQVWVSFELNDSLQIAGEGYPAHEVYLVLTAADGGTTLFDHLELFQDVFGHEVNILNTVNLASQPFAVRPELTTVNLEKAFQTDSVFGTREQAAASFRLDGVNTVVQVKHRPAYNLQAAGSTLDFWFKVNSDDEAANTILTNRGEFTLFQKTGAYLPGYQAIVNRERKVIASIGGQQAFSSDGFRNSLLQPSVGTSVIAPRNDWTNANIYDTYKTAFNATGQQPIEWTDPDLIDGTSIAQVNVATDIGGGKFLLITNDDPYLPAHPSVYLIPILDYLTWHAAQAYGQVMPVAQVSPSGTEGGFVFAPIPINQLLSTVGSQFGDYDPSPAEYSPRWVYSPGPASPDSVIYSPDRPVSPGLSPAAVESIPWPISPSVWGDLPVPWPSDLFRYGNPPVWNPFAFQQLYNDASMQIRWPIFVGGKLTFDRWIHLDIAVAAADLEVGIQSITVWKPQTYALPAATASNIDDLLIGTAAVNALNVAAPVSYYSFKVFQRRLTPTERAGIYTGEAVNFNELQYNVYAANLDYNGDGQLDFWEDDITDLGLWTRWPNVPTNPYKPFPSKIQDAFGQVVPSVADPLQIPTDFDRNRNLLADWYDNAYLQELIDIQTVGFSDGLLFWTFSDPAQATAFDYNDRVWDQTCKVYRPRTLSYLDWLGSVVAAEWNSVTSVQDPMPNWAAAGAPSPFLGGNSPSPAFPWPSFGAAADQLVMTGVKGLFGFGDLLGYRDSLAQLQKEGLVFNYLQVEYHFRAPRTELEALLGPYAHDIETILNDNYRGNKLTAAINPN